MASSIQTRVLALVGVGVFIAGLLVSLVSRSSLLTLEQEVIDEHTRLAAALASGVSAAVEDDMRLLARMALSPLVDLADGNPGPERAALNDIFHLGHVWSAVALLDSDGQPITSEPSESLASFSGPAAEALATRARAHGRPLVSDAIRGPGGGRLVLVVVPFRSTRSRADGVAAAAIDTPSRQLHNLLRTEALGPSVGAVLVDAAGTDLAAARPAADRDTTIGVAPVHATSWRVQITRGGPGPLAPIAAFRRRSFWLAPSLAALATLLAWGIATSVRHPLRRLTQSAERIARGDLEKEVDALGAASGGDEVIRLADALEGMRASLRQSLDDSARANRELERRVSERTRDLADLNARLQERERLRQQLLRKVISAQEEERRRVARELHDETSQTLAALGMGVDATVAVCRDPLVVQRLADLRQLVERMHQELRRLIVNLRPSVLDDLGLAAAISWFATHHLGPSNVAVRCELAPDLDTGLSLEAKTAIFRAVQEAIVNVSRHAQAESVLIQGSSDGRRATIEIEDDGQGFDPATATDGPGSLRGVGLLGMRERIEILGGTLTVDSEPGHGTRVVMEIPQGGQAP
jgi:signal transduction histidine kinase